MMKRGFTHLMTMSGKRPSMRLFTSIRQWTLFGLLLIAFGLLGISPQAEAQEGPTQTFQIMALNETMGSIDPATGAVRLNRTRNEIWGSVHVTDLEANSAFTIWAAIFNRPEECITNPAGPVRCGMPDLVAVPNPARASAFNVGAFVTGVGNGTANVSVHIRSGAPPDGTFVLFGEGGLNDNGVMPGLHEGNGFGAEVHVIVRTHGVILPGAITAQLSMLNGGCPPNTCANVQVATFPSVKD
jgi:hypothetical protein